MDIFQDARLLDAKTTTHPMVKNLKLNVDIDPSLLGQEKYRSLVGRLLYLNLTSLGITHVVQVLSQFLQQPRAPHRDVTVHLLKYLKGAPAKGLFFSSHNDCALRVYLDADWANCPMTKKSLTGYCVFLGPTIVSKAKYH